MNKLVKTNLQKIIFFIGGFSIFIRLLDGGYYDRYNAIFSSLGILVLTITLLIILQDYNPKFHLKIVAAIKKYKKLFILIFGIFFVLVFMGWILYVLYFNTEKDIGIHGIILPELPELPELPDIKF